MMGSYIRRFHLDERGAIAPLLLLLFIFFLYWIVSVLNTGQLTTDKMRVQNAADAAALLHADWTARSLNVMSMNNVALSQSLVALVASATVLEAELDLGARAIETGTTIIQFSAICDGFPPCVAYYFARAEPAFEVAARLVQYEMRYGARKAVAKAEAAISALNKANDYLVKSLPRTVGDASAPLIRENDIDSIYYHVPCQQGDGCGGNSVTGRDLPVSRAARSLAYLELCDAAENGSNGQSRLNYERLGYPRGSGPLKAGGSSRNPEVKNYISQETGLGLLYQRFYTAYPFPEPQLGTTTPPLFIEPQTVFRNDFTQKFDQNWQLACPGGMAGSVLKLGSVLPTPYSLPNGVLGLVGFRQSEDFKILAIAARKRRAIISVDLFKEAMNTDYGYAQSWVFNSSASDLYTQDWQTMLTYASFMDEPLQVLNEMEHRAPAAFGELINLFRSSGDSNAFRAVNQH